MKRPNKSSTILVTAVASLAAVSSGLAASTSRTDTPTSIEISDAAKTQLRDQIEMAMMPMPGPTPEPTPAEPLPTPTPTRPHVLTHDLTHDQTTLRAKKPNNPAPNTQVKPNTPTPNNEPSMGRRTFLTPATGTGAVTGSVMRAFFSCQTASDAD